MKVAIVGTAPSSVDDAPYQDDSWQIWSLGCNAGRIKRFNKWFELHSMEVLTSTNSIDKERTQFFQKIGSDLVVSKYNPIFPDATIYPKDEIVEEFGNYFTSSIAWMIALALKEGATEIGLWGIDMIGDCEYSYQRACCEYMLGIAKGRGVKVFVSPKSPVLRAARMYAFEYDGLSAEIQRRIGDVNQVVANCDAQMTRAIEEKAYAQGVLATLREFERRWG